MLKKGIQKEKQTIEVCNLTKVKNKETRNVGL